ncbi:capsule assembly Wzi family protein [Salisaeta longa]|uniref:capsule assembly Wzi family protein n=1 Tax=Salisaeta longa TaxID=503170 RepID=UPI0003B6B3E5|nr:capsule assembly Wzi family protein [Salisaeta longa]
MNTVNYWIACVLCGVLWGVGPGAAPVQAQRIQAQAGLTAIGGTDDLGPFWIVSNRYGRFGRAGQGVVGDAAVWVQPRAGRRWDVSGGLHVVGRGSEQSALYAQAWYLTGHAGPFALTAGQQATVQGHIDTTLSLGGTTWSKNALPVPRIALYTPDYVSVPFTNDYVAVRGLLSHGWMPADRFVSNAYLHQKQAYLRLLPPRGPVQLHLGVIQNVMWAGTHPQAGELADGWDAFWKVLITEELEGNENVGPEGTDSGVGNTVAAYDVAVTAQGAGWRAKGYRQFYIDTAAGRRFRNFWDGLWGLSLRRATTGHWLDAVLYEHVRFVRQNAVWGASGKKGQRGREIYYNNYLYREGWTRAGRVIGLPLALTDAYAPRLANASDGFPVTNNIIVAHHLGVAGHVAPRWTYRAFLTYSRNHGMLFNPQPRRDQVSGWLSVRGPLAPRYGLALTAGLAVDAGAVFADRAGLLLGLRWNGAWPGP